MNAEAGTSGRGDFVASTIDVDAIKVSLFCGVESGGFSCHSDFT